MGVAFPFKLPIEVVLYLLCVTNRFLMIWEAKDFIAPNVALKSVVAGDELSETFFNAVPNAFVRFRFATP